MLTYKAALILSDGLVFGVLALGMLVAFRWLRFPDLTPDGSFVTGAVAFALGTQWGLPPAVLLFFSLLCGAGCGALTAAVNEVAKVPSLIAGLLTASALYSVNWLLLGKPNQYIPASETLIGMPLGETAAWILVGVLAIIAAMIAACLIVFGRSLVGLRLRAIGENPSLARDLRISKATYTFLGLCLANGLAAMAGALFSQRAYSADVNMGIGLTISGLAAMVLGLLMVKRESSVGRTVICMLLGGLAFRFASFMALEAGLRPEAFRLVSAAVLLFAYMVLRSSSFDVLRGIRWT